MCVTTEDAERPEEPQSGCHSYKLCWHSGQSTHSGSPRPSPFGELCPLPAHDIQLILSGSGAITCIVPNELHCRRYVCITRVTLNCAFFHAVVHSC
jgi:hypothetical protein